LDDKICYYKDTEEFYNKLEIDEKVIELMPNMNHKTFKEIEKEKVLVKISNWLDKLDAI